MEDLEFFCVDLQNLFFKWHSNSGRRLKAVTKRRYRRRRRQRPRRSQQFLSFIRRTL